MAYIFNAFYIVNSQSYFLVKFIIVVESLHSCKLCKHIFNKLAQ